MLDRTILSISQLTRQSRTVLEDRFGLAWVEGEVSNLAQPASGHWYFTLKDDRAQVRCAMFRQHNRRVSYPVKNGDQLLLRAKVSLYEPRGDFQLLVESLEPVGLGLLQQRYEALKEELQAQGLFAPEHKQPLPATVSRLGVITSATGAALQDVLSVIRRRFPLLEVILYPSPVQGASAAASLVRAVEVANARAEVDLLLLTRGGGSIEDLWCFNDTALAHALYRSLLPVVSAVGHEIDFTIADFVADVRAPTPSAAAELVSPDWHEVAARIRTSTEKLHRVLRHQLTLRQQKVDILSSKLFHPRQQILLQRQRLAVLDASLRHTFADIVHRKQSRLTPLHLRLKSLSPGSRLPGYQNRVIEIRERLQRAVLEVIRSCRGQVNQSAAALHSLSPLATLERGYSLVLDDSGAWVAEQTVLHRGQRLQIRQRQRLIQATYVSEQPLDTV